MAHVRTQIRDALALLLAGLTTTADRVFVSRVSPIPQDDLPALVVNVDEEEIELATASTAPTISRGLTIRVAALTRLVDGLDDELDAMTLELELAIAGDDTLAGLLNEPMILTGLEVERSTEGDAPIGRITLTYATRYETTTSAPDVAL